MRRGDFGHHPTSVIFTPAMPAPQPLADPRHARPVLGHVLVYPLFELRLSALTRHLEPSVWQELDGGHFPRERERR